MPKAVASLFEPRLRAAMADVRALLKSRAPTAVATEHMIAVWAVTKMIPEGRVLTYGGVAKLLNDVGISSGPRGVGQALRRNPLAPTVPCHRVVAANRQLHGFNGATEGGEMHRKADLLRKEGVLIEAAVAARCSKVAESCLTVSL